MNLISKLLTSSLVVLSSSAQAFTIDGNLNDWLPNPTGSINDWTPTDSNVKYSVEDQDNSGYLNPGFGGQAYDAEAIYITSDALNFYIAVVTGLSPGTTAFPAGDLAFDFGRDGSYEYGLVVKGDSSGIGNAGDFYKVTKWNVGLWDASGNSSRTGDPLHPTTVKEGTKVLGSNLTELSYQSGSKLTTLGVLGGDHYVIEARVSKSVFGSDLNQAFNLHWTMACANDSILVDPPANVPTADTLTILGIGLTMLMGFKRKKTQAPVSF